MIYPPEKRAVCVLLLLAIAVGGCDTSETVIGRRGISDGRFQKPRAMAVDRQDLLYIVDMTARIQVFDTQGKFIRKWQTPDHSTGKPSGLSIGNDGNVLVADTHYYQLLIYSPEGKLLQTIGGTRGEAPGQFGLVTDAVQDSKDNYYVSEYGEYDRIQKFSSEGEFILEWGGHGEEPGQFARPQNMAIDANDNIWVADACNHRIQVFDSQGKLLKVWGKQGSAAGELYYPYDIILTPEGHVCVCEYGNHRVQKFTADGRSLGCWGSEGRGPGQLFNPWALVQTSDGKILVLDSNNHRVQEAEM
jgi:streptogramin lyase